MQSKIAVCRAFVRGEGGASAAEYSLILGIVGLGVFAAATYLSSAVAAQVGDLVACLRYGGTACK